jgi:FkbM family methyltransferase
MLSRVGFPFVYVPAQTPQYPDFQAEWTNSLNWRQNEHPIRCVFVASKYRLENTNLVPVLEHPMAPEPAVPAPPDIPSAEIMESEILAAAESLAYVRPLVPYPGWRFDIEWDNPDLAFDMRRKIWSYFRDRQMEIPFVLKWYLDLRVMLYLGNDVSKQLFVGGCYDPNEFAWLNSVLGPGMVFVDAGANDGLYSLFAARRVGESGQVWAFEPSDREFQRLCQNLQLNQLHQVRPFRVALSNSDGTAELRIAGPEHAGHNTLGDFTYPVPLLRKESVKTRKLDSLVHEIGLHRIDVLKLDVEGCEMRVLSGALDVLRNMRPVVLFELAEPALLRQGAGTAQLLDLFRSLRYGLYSFDRATGRPVLSEAGSYTDNLIGVPQEKKIS